MTSTLETVRDIFDAGQTDHVMRTALDENDVWQHWMQGEITGDAPPLFNAYAAGCNRLLTREGVPLTGERLEVPEELSWMGKSVINLANQSRFKDSTAAIKLDVAPSYAADACTYSESYLLSSIGLVETDPDTTNMACAKLFVDDDGKPVLFTKDHQASTSINFQEIAIRGITAPPGALIKVLLKRGAAPLKVNGTVRTYNIDTIRAASMLRLTTFAIPVGERYTELHTMYDNNAVIHRPEKIEELELTATIDTIRDAVLARVATEQ